MMKGRQTEEEHADQETKDHGNYDSREGMGRHTEDNDNNDESENGEADRGRT